MSDFYITIDELAAIPHTLWPGLPYSISRRFPDQKTLLSSSEGILESMLMSEWKGKEGTFKKGL